MRLLLASLMTLALALGACTVNGAQSWGPAPTAERSGTPRPEGTPATGPTPGSESVSLEVWLALDSSLVTESGPTETRSGLFRATRTQAATQAVGRAALNALLEGPSAEEAAEGVYSALPAGTGLLGLSITDGLAAVDLSAAFVADADEPRMRLRLAQVVYTITQFSTVRRVAVTVAGSATPAALGDLGISLERRLRREDFADQLPAILVERPGIGERVAGAVAVSGTADVFEATVSMRILDASGSEIARTFTTATCGTGCRGEFSRRVRFAVDAEQPGTLEVFEASALDGSPTNVVRIPLTLLP